MSQRSSSGFGAAKFTKDNIFKFLGRFPVFIWEEVRVEIKFTKDGTPLNVANPHLIVVKQREE
jgi:hypothetical protein